jgi:hypothetical protein
VCSPPPRWISELDDARLATADTLRLQSSVYKLRDSRLLTATRAGLLTLHGAEGGGVGGGPGAAPAAHAAALATAREIMSQLPEFNGRQPWLALATPATTTEVRRPMMM